MTNEEIKVYDFCYTEQRILLKEYAANRVIVNDFSRFTRDYIELESNLEQIFSFLDVCFISASDNYDSSNYKGSITDINVSGYSPFGYGKAPKVYYLARKTVV